MPPKHIVILGGGFASVYAAMHLEKLARGRDDLQISLVSRENYFVFHPLLPEVVSGNIGLTDTISPLNRLLRTTRCYIREIDQVDLERQTVTLRPGFWPQQTVLPYDQLVIGLGTVTDFRGMPGLFEHAFRFKTLQDALVLRNHVLQVLHEASVENDPVRQRQLLTFVIAGGGFSGVEVAAELNDYVRRFARRDERLSKMPIRVVLVHTGERVLDREFPRSLSEYAQKVLEKRGVEMLLKCRLATASPDAAVLNTGERIETKTLISTVPSSPNPIVDLLDLPKERGRLLLNRQLQVQGHSHIWAAGDCALVPYDEEGRFAPPTAQHAIREATVLAQNLVATLDGRPLKTFAFEGLGKMGALGHHSAVAELFGRIRISGLPAWLLWRFVYWSKLPGLDRKIKLALSWMLDLILPPDTVQLKLDGESGVGQAHYEAGEFVFRQGDIGDSLYIILRGEVEVLADSGQGPRSLARLQQGEYFGEMALLNEHSRSASVRCCEPTDLLVVRRGEFTAMIDHLPDMQASFRRIADARTLDSARREQRQEPGGPDAGESS